MAGRQISRRTRTGATDYRLVAVGIALIVAWVAIGVRLFQVQVVRADELAAMGLDQRLTVKELAADRGNIFDREGRELAITVDATTIYANPQQVTNPEVTSTLIAAALGLDADELFEKLSSDRSFVFLARQVEWQQAEPVTQLTQPGIHWYAEPKRVYPAGSMAAQVVGFVNIDNQGIEGLEYEYDEELSGYPGRLEAEQDPGGRLITFGEYDVVAAIPGSDLVTTIDREIQFVAEEVCEDTIARTAAQRCSVVVLDPATGEVLAMVTLPGFDPGNRSGADPDRFRNWTALSVFEPGSTQKLVTVAAALEESAVSWTTTFEVPDQIEIVDGACPDNEEVYGCFSDIAPHEPRIMSVKDIVTRSSNVGTILIGRELGEKNLARYLEAFNYGAPTGIDFPGEAAGQINLANGCQSCPASAAIGYSVSVTELQMAAVYATIANDGVWVQPHLVKEIVDGTGVRSPIDPKRREVVSAETARVVRLLLQSVVESDEGTGHGARVSGYSVGGKTGTTRRFVEGEGYSGDFVASFIGMAPIENPEIVVAVVVDAPYSDNTGGRAAAPAFAEIVERTLHQMGVAPDAS
ncbi:MAG: penicillin-binding protein 2 [Acidimicrobiia bacterium]|nr:penicillin-binding protein 2 [Acidimicrobiia bacterium]MDH3397497.1 penicillin-binding protein 2 [Acidimicrobiia bacterium]